MGMVLKASFPPLDFQVFQVDAQWIFFLNGDRQA